MSRIKHIIGLLISMFQKPITVEELPASYERVYELLAEQKNQNDNIMSVISAIPGFSPDQYLRVYLEAMSFNIASARDEFRILHERELNRKYLELIKKRTV